MSFDPLEFQDRRIVVTGGTQGTGRAVIQRLADAGAVVVTAARSARPEEGLCLKQLTTPGRMSAPTAADREPLRASFEIAVNTGTQGHSDLRARWPDRRRRPASPVAAQAVSGGDGTTVVLVHGAFDNGASWNKVIPALQAKGLHVVLVSNPLTSLADDVPATRRVLDAQTGPVVLVGHLWGGSVITEVGTHERVKGLVYVAAFAPCEGESIVDLTKDYPRASGLDHTVADRDGFVTMTAEGIAKHFAQDLPGAETRLIAATQAPIPRQELRREGDRGSLEAQAILVCGERTT